MYRCTRSCWQPPARSVTSSRPAERGTDPPDRPAANATTRSPTPTGAAPYATPRTCLSTASNVTFVTKRAPRVGETDDERFVDRGQHRPDAARAERRADGEDVARNLGDVLGALLREVSRIHAAPDRRLRRHVGACGPPLSARHAVHVAGRRHHVAPSPCLIRVSPQLCAPAWNIANSTDLNRLRGSNPSPITWSRD